MVNRCIKISFKDFMRLKSKPYIKILNFNHNRSSKSINEIKENIKSLKMLNTVDVVNDNDIGAANHFEEKDIVLQVKTYNDNDMIHTKNKLPLRWLFVDAITYSGEDDSCLVAQIKPNRENPFDLNDSKFVAAFKGTFNSLDWDDVCYENCKIKNLFWGKVLDKKNSLDKSSRF